MQQNIVVLGFNEDSKAYQAFSVLKEAAALGRVELHLRAQHVAARHARFDAWRTTQKQRLHGMAQRVKHVLQRESH